MGALSTWEVNYALLEGSEQNSPIENPCVELTVEEEGADYSATSSG